MTKNCQENPPIYPLLSTVEADIRDPNDINKHLRLDFFNVIAEPDPSSFSFQFLHTASKYVYHYSKLFIYRLLTIIVGIPLMLFWGLMFGVYSFSMIWIAVPMRRIAQSAISEAGIYIQIISDAVLAPVHRSMGLIFSNIRMSLSHQTIHSTKSVEV